MSDGTPENRHCDSSDGPSVVVVVPASPEPPTTAAESDADASTTAAHEVADAASAADGDSDDVASVSESSTAVARGLSSMISSVIRDFDVRAEETGRSQDQLSSSIDRLTRGFLHWIRGCCKTASRLLKSVFPGRVCFQCVPFITEMNSPGALRRVLYRELLSSIPELDQLLEDAPMPFIMQHAVKISIVRKRVSSLNTLLKSIQRRLDNVDRMLTVGLLQDKGATENVRPN